MDYRYHILFSVFFRHSYFAGNNYNGFTVEPDADTLHHFKRLSLLFKQVPGGFRVLYETNKGLDRTRESILAEPITLGFRIMNTDTDFVNYTDGIPDNIMDAVLFLHNKKEQGDTDTGLLHEGSYFSVGDILQNKAPDQKNPNDRNRLFFSKPFGWLQLDLHEQLENTLYANFKGKETLWRYIINSEHLMDLSAPAVIHKETKEAFTGPVWVVLPDGNKRMAFESKTAIPLSSKPEKVFQLVEDYQPDSGKYKVVLSVLPNPNVKLISLIQSADGKQENNFSEIFI